MTIPEFLTPMNITLIILFLTAFFFIQGKYRTDIVALCALIALTLTGILEPNEALAGFSNSVVIMMIGLFVVSAGIFRTGLAKLISSRILLLAGKNDNLLFFLVMLVTALVGAFISNTGTVAVMLPIVISIAASANVGARRFLMPLAFASSMGLFTLISTPPNLVIQEVLVSGGYEPLSFFSFAPVGCVVVVVGIVVLFFLSKILVSKNDSVEKKDKKGKSIKDLVDSYNLNRQLCKVMVDEYSSLNGVRLSDSCIRSEYGVNVVKIVRKSGSRLRPSVVEELASPDSVLMKDDILYCQGSDEDVDLLVNEKGLILLDSDGGSGVYDMNNYGVAELYILPRSGLVNHTIKNISFRDKYGVNVIGIQHNGNYNIELIADQKLHSGDALLVQGDWDTIARLADNQDDFVLVGQPLKEAAKSTIDHKTPVAAAIMLFMILVMAFDLIPGVMAVIGAAVLMVITGCLKNAEEAYGSINWESIVLIAAMMPMSTAFEKTGITTLISGFLMDSLGEMGPYILMAGVYFCTSLMTMVISNTATAVLMAPIAMQTAIIMGLSPYPFLFSVAVAASMCFASPFSTPPNALVMTPGGYTFIDYIKVGLPLQLIMGIVMVLVLPLIFPF
ncbi:MAG: SLC13 family permease [Rikenellaceae bacterium]|nr:SLC13 family permease [Rikenellaceae bacterium]